MHDAHLHEFREVHGDTSHARDNEKRMWLVVLLTAATMVVELAVGFFSGSMALLADGFHMGTHAGALALSGLAYWFARTRATDEAYSFGTGKVYALAGYTNAVALALVSAWMIYESVERLFAPQPISFGEALPVAVLGLVVNLLSVKLLGHDHSHAGHSHDHAGHDHAGHDHAGHDHAGHDHAGHDHAGHDHAGHDHADQRQEPHELPLAATKVLHADRVEATDQNLRAAYLHVLADALTSVLAIMALLAGKYFGIVSLDPVMGLVGAVVILRWAYGLCRDTARQLLDVSPSAADQKTIRARLEEIDDVQVADLHLWEIGPGERGCIVKLVTARPREPAYYRQLIKSHVSVSHLTVEVQRCPCN